MNDLSQNADAVSALQPKEVKAADTRIYFSDFFSVDPAVLKDYGAFQKERGGTIADFIDHVAASRYQLTAPDGCTDWILSTGRALVIFDGLDELLDTSHRVPESLQM